MPNVNWMEANVCIFIYNVSDFSSHKIYIYQIHAYSAQKEELILCSFVHRMMWSMPVWHSKKRVETREKKLEKKLNTWTMGNVSHQRFAEIIATAQELLLTAISSVSVWRENDDTYMDNLRTSVWCCSTAKPFASDSLNHIFDQNALCLWYQINTCACYLCWYLERICQNCLRIYVEYIYSFRFLLIQHHTYSCRALGQNKRLRHTIRWRSKHSHVHYTTYRYWYKVYTLLYTIRWIDFWPLILYNNRLSHKDPNKKNCPQIARNSMHNNWLRKCPNGARWTRTLNMFRVIVFIFHTNSTYF